MSVREYENDRESLLRETKRKERKLETQQRQMLDAVAEGEDFDVETFEWVELGNVEIKVKAWFPGETLDQMSQFATADPETVNPQESIQANINALVEMTETITGKGETFDTKTEIRTFWENAFSKWGDQFLAKAVKTVVTPAKENSDTEDVVDSFRSEKRPSDRGASEWRS